MARAAGDEGALAAALLGRHAALLDIDHVEERLAVIDEALAVAERLEAGELVALALHWRIYDLVELGEVEQAGRAHERLQALAHELHQPLYSHAALAWRAVAAHLNGHFEEAERIARESLRIAEAAGAPEARAFFLTQLFAVRREQGRLGRARRPARAAVAGPRPGRRELALDAAVHPRRGGRARARAGRLRGGRGRRLRRAAREPVPPHRADLPGRGVRRARRRGGRRVAPRPARAARRPARADRLQRLLGLGPALPRPARVTAGRPDEARAQLEAALARHLELDAPGLVARTRCDLGELLLAHGEREHGLELLAAAGAAAAELGMAGVAARADVSGAKLGAL